MKFLTKHAQTNIHNIYLVAFRRSVSNIWKIDRPSKQISHGPMVLGPIDSGTPRALSRTRAYVSSTTDILVRPNISAMHHCRRHVSYKARITNGGQGAAREEEVPLSRGVLFHFRAHQSFALTGSCSGQKLA